MCCGVVDFGGESVESEPPLLGVEPVVPLDVAVSVAVGDGGHVRHRGVTLGRESHPQDDWTRSSGADLREAFVSVWTWRFGPSAVSSRSCCRR